MKATLEKPSGKHEGIDALRGIAALLVVFFHMNHMGFGVITPAWTHVGMLGVNLFFTLSGFLIARCVMVPTTFSSRHYIENRSRRILPNYFIALLLVVTLVDVRNLLHVPVLRASQDLLTHLFLVHGWFPSFATSIMGPFWTLSHEWMFYALMLGVAFFLRSRLWWLVPLAMTAVAITARFGHLQKWWVLPGGWLHPLAVWDQFASGIFAAGWTLRRSTWAARFRPLLLLATIVLVGWSIWNFYQPGFQLDSSRLDARTFTDTALSRFYGRRSNALWFSPILAAGVGTFLAWLWLAPARRWRLPILPWMGKVSYSTYLYHAPVALCFMRAFKNLPEESFWQHRLPSFLLVFTAIYAFSAFAWHFFEKPWMERRKT